MAVFAFEGVVLADLAIPLEIFAMARAKNGQACYDVKVWSSEREVGSKHLLLKLPRGTGSITRADTVIVPGLDDLQQPVPPRVLRVLRDSFERGVRIASICTGAFILARAGVLDGLRATTHWRAAAVLAQRFPNVVVDPNVLYVDNGQVLTSAGACAGLDLCLHIVRRDYGAAVAASVARAAVMPLERSGGQAQFIEYELPETNESMGPLLTWLEKNLKHSFSLGKIARQARMSPRTLSRRFPEQVGMTPAQWIARARVRRAQQLLELTSHSVERIAVEVGFRSASVFREHFSGLTGISPTAYRRSFGTHGA